MSTGDRSSPPVTGMILSKKASITVIHINKQENSLLHVPTYVAPTQETQFSSISAQLIPLA